MGILSSKWVLLVLVLITILVILYRVGRKSVHTEVTIVATPSEVWSVLTNVSTIKEWNKVLIPIEGELNVGNSIKYEFYQDEGGKASVIDAEVIAIAPDQLLNQQGGMNFILTFDHKYILEPSPTGTKVRIEEYYRGIMVPFWNPSPVESAYHRLLISLKQRVEQKESM